MPDLPDEAARWTGDVNDAAVEAWRDDTTAGERVGQVLDVTTEPQTASTIAERARVSEPTARKHLESLVDEGRAKAVRSNDGARYVRSPQGVATERIAAIHREYTKAQLREAIGELKSELGALRRRHDVGTVDELAVEIDPGEDGWADVRRWEELEENLAVAEAAIALYDFDPDDSEPATGEGHGRRRSSESVGSLAEDSTA